MKFLLSFDANDNGKNYWSSVEEIEIQKQDQARNLVNYYFGGSINNSWNKNNNDILRLRNYHTEDVYNFNN